MQRKTVFFLKDWAIGYTIYLPIAVIFAVVAGLLMDTSLSLVSFTIIAILGVVICAGSSYAKVRKVFPKTKAPNAPSGQLPSEHPAERRRHGPFTEG